MWKQSTGKCWHKMRDDDEPICRLPVWFAENARSCATRPAGRICQLCARKLGLDVEARLLAGRVSTSR